MVLHFRNEKVRTTRLYHLHEVWPGSHAEHVCTEIDVPVSIGPNTKRSIYGAAGRKSLGIVEAVCVFA